MESGDIKTKIKILVMKTSVFKMKSTLHRITAGKSSQKSKIS